MQQFTFSVCAIHSAACTGINIVTVATHRSLVPRSELPRATTLLFSGLGAPRGQSFLIDNLVTGRPTDKYDAGRRGGGG